MKKTTIFKKIKQYFTAPAKTFKAESKSKLKDALLYGLFGVAVYTVLYILVSTINFLLNNPIVLQSDYWKYYLSVPVIIFCAPLVFALWLHLWAFIFGARKGIVNTLKIVLYGRTPYYFLAWIPLVNWPVEIWSLVLYGYGLVEIQKLSATKAVATVVISAITTAVFYWVYMIMFIVS